MKPQWVGLVGDIGGTNARFALVDAQGHVRHPRIFACRQYASLADIVAEYIETTAGKTLGPGMFVRGEFELGRREALTLPQAAVVLREGFTYVFRIEGEGSETATNTAAATAKVALTKVGTGRRLGERIEVAGLAPDARVVASGAGFLADGDTVRLVAPETAAVTPAASATKAAP